MAVLFLLTCKVVNRTGNELEDAGTVFVCKSDVSNTVSS